MADRRRSSVSERWGIRSDEPWLGIPRRLRDVLRDRGARPGEQVVLFDVIDRWRPDLGDTVPVSLAEVSGSTGLSREYVRQCLIDLAEKRSLIGFFSEQGRKAVVDLEPAIAAVRFGAQLSTPADELSSGADSTVNPGRRTVNSLGSPVTPKSKRIKSKSSRAGENRPPGGSGRRVHGHAIPGETQAEANLRLLEEMQRQEAADVTVCHGTSRGVTGLAGSVDVEEADHMLAKNSGAAGCTSQKAEGGEA